ncbi:MAG TPA: hypothetical protein DCM28_00120 [Phycisphaerales bacterium]|mgnify:CR=1 FL=1|nr:hypothetical protein [Phycisphaerales bacterium]HCD32942.1 hypothetical protein [Phycisphaerales bacterium]|tara:strand:+ start:32377 stop:35448 length:3072 start_codon:yes stop_codon:yes gene_type:complete
MGIFVFMNPHLHQTFIDPPATWRAIPFWSLNDKLDLTEIRRQLRAFDKGGFGGAYLHSRVGLLTEYLGDDWWDAMDAGVDECEKLGIEAWFYDEDKWPSGFAGGIVPLQDEAFHSRYMARLTLDRPIPENAFELGTDANWRYLCCKVDMGNIWFNGTCWVDLLNPDMVRAFIDCTYKPYAQRYASRDRKILRGIFTDEPQFNPRWPIDDATPLPFSPIILDDFKDQHGYDLRDHLTSLYENVNDQSPQVRLHYFTTLARRMEKSFTVQLAQYCAEHDLTFTGHYNGEQTFISVLQNVGNMMIQYRHMQQPGIDHLGLSFGNMPDIHAMRCLSSVANQYGQPRRLSEMFGISGQNMTFEDRCWIAEGHAIMGINHICPHLTLYSLKGCRKRDYPPTISPQQPWWDFNRSAEDRMARSAMLSSQGEYGAELLVIHPLESAYVELANGSHGPQDKLDARFNDFMAVIKSLQNNHRDYDLGDEEILSDIAAVEDGMLIVGKMRYNTVVLPPMATIRPSTIALLKALIHAGGKVIAVNTLPQCVDGLINHAAFQDIAKQITITNSDQLATHLATINPPAVTVAGEDSDQIWIHRRIVNGKPLVMLLNRSRLKTITVTVTINDINDAVQWDPISGQCSPTSTPTVLTLAAAQSVFISDGSLCPTEARSVQQSKSTQVTETIACTQPTGIMALDDNAMTLDFASASTDGGQTWRQAEPVLGLHERFTRDKWSGRLLLRFTAVAKDAIKQCALVVEQSEIYTAIRINGQLIQASDKVFWCDRTMHRLTIDGLIVEGENIIELELDYVAPVQDSLDAIARYGSEIESVYLVGDFQVKAHVSDQPAAPTERSTQPMLPDVKVHRFSSFELTRSGEIQAGELTLAGYPFYAGRMAMSFAFNVSTIKSGMRYMLRLDPPNAIVAVPSVNGQELAAITCCPWELDITEQIRVGENQLTLTLVNSLRNLLGPHHHRDGELSRLTPQSFGGGFSWASGGPGDSEWYDVRLEREPIIWRDDYHMIAFGLKGLPRVDVCH